MALHHRWRRGISSRLHSFILDQRLHQQEWVIRWTRVRGERPQAAASLRLMPVHEALSAFEDVERTRRGLEPRRIPGACLSTAAPWRAFLRLANTTAHQARYGPKSVLKHFEAATSARREELSPMTKDGSNHQVLSSRARNISPGDCCERTGRLYICIRK